MTEGDVLRVRVETGEGARRRVLAPAVGLWSAHPGPGALLGPGAAVGAIIGGGAGAVMRGDAAVIPAETLIGFELRSPLTIQELKK